MKKVAIAEVRIKGLTPYSPSRFHDTPKLKYETINEYQRRTWREHAHVNDKGFIILPSMGFKNGFDEAASRLSRGVCMPTSKVFESGIMVVDEEILIEPRLHKKDAQKECFFSGWDGRGALQIVCFMRIPKWEATVRFIILDSIITKSIFAQHMEVFGSFIGLGRFRPARRGFYGRFAVQKIKWG